MRVHRLSDEKRTCAILFRKGKISTKKTSLIFRFDSKSYLTVIVWNEKNFTVLFQIFFSEFCLKNKSIFSYSSRKILYNEIKLKIQEPDHLLMNLLAKTEWRKKKHFIEVLKLTMQKQTKIFIVSTVSGWQWTTVWVTNRQTTVQSDDHN